MKSTRRAIFPIPMPGGDVTQLESIAVADGKIDWIVEPDSREPFKKLTDLPAVARPRGITWMGHDQLPPVGRVSGHIESGPEQYPVPRLVISARFSKKYF